METRAIITLVLLGIGCFFIVVASVGIIRFPDFYTRVHPAGKTDTMGQAAVLIGLAVYEGLSLVSVKLVIIMLFLAIANPTATHALAKAAYVAGLRPWRKGEPRR